MNDKQRNISLLIIDFLMVISLLIFILSHIELFSIVKDCHLSSKPQ